MVAEWKIFMGPGRTQCWGQRGRNLVRRQECAGEQGEVTETSGSEDIQGVLKMKNSATNMPKISTYIEPPMFLNQDKLYVSYKEELKNGSRITCIDKRIQVELIVYNLYSHTSGIKEKIQDGNGDKLEGNGGGIDDMITFLDEIYLKKKRPQVFEVLAVQEGQISGRWNGQSNGNLERAAEEEW